MTSFLELIETLWNVNMLTQFTESLRSKELIETLWNVNKETSYLTRISSRN